MQKITIIGGSDGFGKWMAEFIYNEFKNDIELTITGRNEDKLIKVSNAIGCKYSTSNREVIIDSDITIFAVPISHTEKIIKTYAPYLKLGSMVLDVTSIKKGPSEALKNHSPKGVLVLPTHPMFGPFISTIAGQIFVLCPINESDKNDSRYIFLKKYLIKSGAKVVEESASDHDEMMAVVQGLTHFNMFVLADTMKRLDFDIKKSFSFVSPIYKLMISSVGRYVGHNPKLYSDIQINNTEVLKVHKEFMKSTSMFNEFVENKDEESFIKTIEESQKYFGESTKQGQLYTDKIIYMLGKQVDLVERLIGKEINLENIYSKKLKTGILIKYENRKLYLESKEELELDEWNVIN